MGGSDVETLLQKGRWSTSRAKSPDLKNASNSPRGSTYSFQGEQAIPRRMPYHLGLRKPPPPSVEDENDALAKEAGSVVSSVPSEEPPNRGDPNQYPILLPVEEQMYQHNPERRFVLVSNQDDGSSDVSDPDKKTSQRRRSTERPAGPDPEPDFYEANTCRKRPGDLPPIITDAASEPRPQDTRRVKPVSRADSRGDDYFSPRVATASSRTPRERTVAPEIIEHATNGRDRSYYRGGSSPESHPRNRSAHPNDQRSRNVANDRKYKDREPSSAHSRSPTLQKRRTSELSKYSRRDSRGSVESSRQFADRMSSRSSRKPPSSTASLSDRDSSSQPSSAPRVPPHQNDTFYSSEDEPIVRLDHRSRRKSALSSGKPEYLSTPVESRTSSRRKSRPESTLPSPRLSQTSLSEPYSSSSSSRSSTFPRESRHSRDRGDRPEQPPPPRASTSKGSFTGPRNMIPAAAAVASASSLNVLGDRRNPPAGPPPPRVNTRVQPPTPSAATPSQMSWQPPRFEPPLQSSTAVSPPISSYRRFSTEVHSGELPDIPHCPRTRPEAGHMDWLTLPKCDNFNLCPSCFSANFASTSFRNEFVLMPFRPSDRPLACDFGASEYYRIAWLFTLKYGRRDLGLFHSLTKIAAQVQPCTGHREVSRIWYSIRDPTTKRLINEFTVCPACAKTTEALLPSLTGLFVPLDSPAEPTRGVCAMHHDLGHDRGRFLLYFDVLEGAADRAFETKTAPNVQAISTRIRQLAVIPPCPEDLPLINARWHTMRTVPNMVVCPECFLMVVQPLLDGREDLTVAGDFHYGPGTKERASCTLYSDRMRSIFQRAVSKKDLGYLRAKVNERLDKKNECAALLNGLKHQSFRTPWTANDQERIMREWKSYE